ncbi:MAG: sulfatase-like hydrolase/transferase [Bacteroidia bacterium]
MLRWSMYWTITWKDFIAKLKRIGRVRQYLIIFTSDNGPHIEGGADPDYFDSNGPYKGYKRDLYEGGIRVPMIAVWDGKIKPGTTLRHASAFGMYFLPFQMWLVLKVQLILMVYLFFYPHYWARATRT